MALESLLKRKKFTFEVMLCIDGRWTIEGILDQENEAITFARKILARKKGEEVKIIRYRKTRSGQSFATEILHEKCVRPKEPPIGIVEPQGDVPLCQGTDDLYELDGILVVSRLLRQFLMRHEITATELLHDWRYLRKLIDSGSLVGSATHKIASLQAAAQGVPTKERLDALEAIIGQVVGRAQDLAAERRRMPKPDDGDLGFIFELIESRYEPHDHAYVFLSVLAQKFYGLPSVIQRLDLLLGFVDEGLEPAMHSSIEGMMAECLDYSDVVQELFGPQPHLASFLCKLIDILKGDMNGHKDNITPTLASVVTLIADGKAPNCRKVLIDRLVRELASTKPFNRRDPKQDKKYLETVTKRLQMKGGELLGGAEAKRAIAVRKKSLRQEELRALGMHDVADAM